MGNQISNNNGELTNIQTSKLTQFIQKWALEKYDGGLNYNKNESEHLLDILKKRAACTGQLAVNIAIPEIQQVGLIPSDNDKIVYSSINIKVFKDNKELQDYINSSNGFSFTIDKGVIRSSSTCGNRLYRPLCNQVYLDRNNIYTTTIQKLYGPLPDINNTDNRKVNAYSECNCENSFYKINDVENALIGSDTSGISNDVLAQNLDKRCTAVINTAYKLVDNRMTGNLQVCINEQKIGGNITATEKSEIGFVQTCTQTIKTESGTGKKVPVPTPSGNTELPKSNDILLYSAVASIVIFNLIFLLRK
jgi:hypothetical protein